MCVLSVNYFIQSEGKQEKKKTVFFLLFFILKWGIKLTRIPAQATNKSLLLCYLVFSARAHAQYELPCSVTVLK